MLGQKISDPEGVEGHGDIRGMQLLPVNTVFLKEKTRTRVEGHFLKLRGMFAELSGLKITGYEIHMGETSVRPQTEILSVEDGEHRVRLDGAASKNVCGCYIHGVFDNERVAGQLVKLLLEQKGYGDMDVKTHNMQEYKNSQYDELARIMRESLDMDAIYQILEEGI